MAAIGGEAGLHPVEFVAPGERRRVAVVAVGDEDAPPGQGLLRGGDGRGVVDAPDALPGAVVGEGLGHRIAPERRREHGRHLPARILVEPEHRGEIGAHVAEQVDAVLHRGGDGGLVGPDDPLAGVVHAHGGHEPAPDLFPAVGPDEDLLEAVQGGARVALQDSLLLPVAKPRGGARVAVVPRTVPGLLAVEDDVDDALGIPGRQLVAERRGDDVVGGGDAGQSSRPVEA